MDEETKKQIINALTKRVESFVCPMCHQSKYSFVDGYTVDAVQKDYKNIRLGGRLIPSVMLVCNNCGHIDRFSLGVLGLIDQGEQQQDK